MMRFSAKQRRVLTWWRPDSPDAAFEAIICDGAVRSGKTLCMGLSFFLWASACYSGARFGLCGKTIASLRRNVVTELLPKLQAIGFSVRERRTENLLQVSYRGHTNEFYLFGGRDEGSAALIQGITFAGVLLDEVALMPRSFVEQACARCSVTGSRLWFNCNPEGPYHWFYTEWIGHAAERNCLYLHFTMEDNPALSPDIRSRYARLYSGVFYRRFVLGQWVAAEGRVYDFFDAAKAPPPPEGPFNQWYISCDYGTVNPASFGLWGRKDAVWYRVKEFYFDSRREQRQMTDAEYERALRELAGGRPIAAVIVMGGSGSYESSIPNPNLGWEKNYNLNVGLDLSFINRIFLTVEYYNRDTKDLLYSLPISATTGFTNYLSNIGQLNNKGVELELRTINIANDNFNWTTVLNLSHNKNKIVSLNGQLDQSIEGTWFIHKVGLPYYSFYVKEYAGVNPENGKAMYYRNQEIPQEDGSVVVDRSLTEDPGEAQAIPYKSVNPKVSGGLTNMLNYKWLDLSFTLTYSLGGYSFDKTGTYIENGTDKIYTSKYNLPVYALDRWQEPGDVTDVPRFVYGEAAGPQNSSRYIHSTNHLRLKNLTLGFTLPSAWTRPEMSATTRLV